MERLKKYINRNLYVFTSIVIFGTSLLFAGAILLIFSITTPASKTSVGYIYLGNQATSQYQQILQSEISTWHHSAEHHIRYQEYDLEISLEFFEFDVITTIESIVENERNEAVFTISQENRMLLNKTLTDYFSQQIIDEVNLDLLIESIIDHMNRLINIKTYDLIDYFSTDISKSLINDKILTNIKTTDVLTITAIITEFTIEKNQRFSLLNTLNEYELSNDQLSIIASGLQSVIRKTSLSGIIREQNIDMPSWAELGANVRILKVNQYDFTFFNHQNYAYYFEIAYVNETSIKFTLKSYPYITSYQTIDEVKSVIPYSTIYNEDLSLNPLTLNIIISETDEEITYRILDQEGINGSVIFYYRIITPLHGNSTQVKIFDEQYYPIPAIYRENIIIKE